LKPRYDKPLIGRADLVRVGLSTDLGRALGYDFDPDAVENDVTIGLQKGIKEPKVSPRIEFVARGNTETPFLVASSFERIDEKGEGQPPPPPPAASPKWLNRPTDPPEYLPLADTSELAWRFGRMAPGIRQSRKPDTEKIVQRLAKARPLTSLPRKQYPAPRALQIVYDRSPRLAPFWRDHRFAQTAVPDGALEYVFESAGRQFVRIGGRERSAPDPDEGPLVVLGDLGAFGPPHAAELWADLGDRFAERDVPVFALVPCALSDLPARMTSIWQAAQWESRAPLDPGDRAAAVEDLLMWCSYAGRVEPGLLRSLRRALTDADAACEILVYRHDAVASPSAEALTLDPHAIAKYRRRFEREVKRSPEAAKRAWQILRSWRQPIGDEFMFEEVLSLPNALYEPLGIDARDIAHARAFWAAMSDGARNGSLSTGAVEWLERVGIRREPDELGLLDHPTARHAIEWAFKRRTGGRVRSEHLRVTLGRGFLSAGEADGSPICTMPFAKRDIWVEAFPEDLAPGLLTPLAVFRDRLSDGGEGPEMVSLPLGSFLMGSPVDEEERFEDEGPQHRVQIDEPYALAKYPVTFEEYDTFCAATGREKPDDRGWGRGRLPVINVDWEDARAYCEWLSEQTGAPYHLPSEAEWEYACRAGTTTRYWWGDDWDPKAANGPDSGHEKTTEVGSYPQNPWGLHDTHGNVWEWCEDTWAGDYTTPRTQTAFPSNDGDARRVIRGGPWDGRARLCRAAYRGGVAPEDRDVSLGFRPARGKASGALAGSGGAAGAFGPARGAVSGANGQRTERGESPPSHGDGESGFSNPGLIHRRVMPGGSASILLAELPPAPFVIRTDRAELVIQRLTRSDLGGWASGLGRDRYGLWADFAIDDIRQRLRWCPPGRFWMGSPENEAGRYDNEGPQTDITLEQGFWLFDTPVTQELYEAVTGKKNPSRFISPTRPVENVDWNDAQDFMARINERLKQLDGDGDGLQFTLPSEAQWEYACRAGTAEATYAGPLEILGANKAPILDKVAWYGGNSGKDFELEKGDDSSGWPEKQYDHRKAGTMPVKMKSANPWGFYDMLGNVWEWCEDAWQGSHEGAAPDASPRQGSQQGGDSRRVIRGGSWNGGAWFCRAAVRDRVAPVARFDDLGFRPARGQFRSSGRQESAKRSGLRSGDGRGERSERASPERSEGPPSQRDGGSNFSAARKGED